MNAKVCAIAKQGHPFAVGNTVNDPYPNNSQQTEMSTTGKK